MAPAPFAGSVPGPAGSVGARYDTRIGSGGPTIGRLANSWRVRCAWPRQAAANPVQLDRWRARVELDRRRWAAHGTRNVWLHATRTTRRKETGPDVSTSRFDECDGARPRAHRGPARRRAGARRTPPRRPRASRPRPRRRSPGRTASPPRRRDPPAASRNRRGSRRTSVRRPRRRCSSAARRSTPACAAPATAPTLAAVSSAGRTCSARSWSSTTRTAS